MPNWCMTNVKIESDKASINKLRKELEAALSKNPLGADFGDNWLGNLLLHIGEDPEKVRSGAISCRGSVDEMSFDPEKIELDITSAWSPPVDCVKMFVEHYLPEDSFSLLYAAEEPGNRLYLSNDPDYIGTASIDAYGLSDLPDEYEYIKDILAYNGKPAEEVEKVLKDMVDEEEYLDALINSHVCAKAFRKRREMRDAFVKDEPPEVIKLPGGNEFEVVRNLTPDEERQVDAEINALEESARKELRDKTIAELEEPIPLDARLDILAETVTEKLENLNGGYLAVNVYQDCED